MTPGNSLGNEPNRQQSDGPVLVTGASGLVGSAVVRRLAETGHRVVATDLDLAGERDSAEDPDTPSAVRMRQADLTDPSQVDALLNAVAPSVIVHLAAMIPPQCYRRRTHARAVNVEATASLLRAAGALPVPPRFVYASSVAVHGARNPHRIDSVLSARTPVGPADLYGAHKAAAERLVRASDLDWVILRLGGVLTAEPRVATARDTLYFEACLPADGRIHTVDVRDVAQAFTAAVNTSAVREIFPIGGDDSHRLRHSEVSSALSAALGVAGGMPPGRPGDPGSDQAWFTTDWIDTRRSQEVLSFQRHSLPDMLAETRQKPGAKRHLLRAAAPIARRFLARRSPYRDYPGTFADPWTAIRLGIGDPEP